jgi:hypothetical protein
MRAEQRQLLESAERLLGLAHLQLLASSLEGSPLAPLSGLASATRSVRRAQFELKKLLSREPSSYEMCGRTLNNSSDDI